MKKIRVACEGGVSPPSFITTFLRNGRDVHQHQLTPDQITLDAKLKWQQAC